MAWLEGKLDKVTKHFSLVYPVYGKKLRIFWPAFWLTVKTGLIYLLLEILFYALVATGLILFALAQV